MAKKTENKLSKFNLGQTGIQMVMTVALIIAAFMIGSMWTELRILKGSGGLVGAGNAPQPTAQAPAEEDPVISDDLWKEILQNPVAEKGNKDAKVTLVEFTDYQCPFCKRHFDETDKTLQADYVATGKMRYVVRDLPLSFHDNAHPAAEAARCAGDQGMYFEFHDKLFVSQEEWSELPDAGAKFKDYAFALGLNQGTFASCYDSGKYKAAVDADLALANKVGASGTPTFFINGTRVVGAQPLSAFTSLIEAGL